ncbi:chorismate mutase 1, chloroplastic isoform X2 [Macadamia integrifolia]|uniref:chorismate mutase 1, chloroplastic isoform X2 n=1 Tax=Macadamia integrifolia TaxID=60698 RepID=UPI001C4F104B|nr:chorismate mutase 1, chloroplastic isoform X2 [Macadamia integrifolia]
MIQINNGVKDLRLCFRFYVPFFHIFSAQLLFHHAIEFQLQICPIMVTKKTYPLRSSFSYQVGRYNSPDEHPFYPADLPEPILPPLQYPQVLHPIANSININKKIWDMYFSVLLPRLITKGDDGNCGSAAVCDTNCLQALSKRIHYGKFVAEAKYKAAPAVYEAAIRAQDRDQLLALLTYEAVEALIKKRVEMKAGTYGQQVRVNGEEGEDDPSYKIKPSIIADLYGDWIMPLTKEVQVEYLMRRLD